MNICPQCPMRDERYIPSDQEDKRRISHLRIELERVGDFLEYLFDHSEHLDHITYREAWAEFEKWGDAQSDAE